MDVHRAARVAHAGHGGQVLLSETTAPLVRGELPQGVILQDLGRHRLKHMRYPERIHQLLIEGLGARFPPLKSLQTLPEETPLVLPSLPSSFEAMGDEISIVGDESLVVEGRHHRSAVGKSMRG